LSNFQPAQTVASTTTVSTAGVGQPSIDLPASTAIPTFNSSAAANTSYDSAATAYNSQSASQDNQWQPATTMALDGYCPIALKTQGQWVEGKQEYSVKHRGKLNCLSSQQALDQLMAEPLLQSPQSIAR
jgi:hypothetical protein